VSAVFIFPGAGVALDWNVQLNAARTSIQRVVLFNNSGKSPYRFVFEVAMVQNCHFSTHAASARNWQLYASKPPTGSCYSQAPKNPEFLPEKWARTSVVGILQHLHNQNALIQTN
jgi:hypothetical protein